MGPLDGMIESLIAEAEAPPREVKGVGQGFLDGEFLVFFLVVQGNRGGGVVDDILSMQRGCKGVGGKGKLD